MIRISGDFGGMVVVALAGILAASLITGVLEWIKKAFMANSPGGQKVMSTLYWVIWLAAIALIVLDLTGVAPIIRNVLFSLMGE